MNRAEGIKKCKCDLCKMCGHMSDVYEREWELENVAIIDGWNE